MKGKEFRISLFGLENHIHRHNRSVFPTSPVAPPECGYVAAGIDFAIKGRQLGDHGLMTVYLLNAK